MIYIYGLIDPFTKEIRYIGKSTHPKERLTNHCNDRSITWRTNWIRQCLASGKRPELIILQTLSNDDDWQAAEQEWIKKARDMGWPLTNCTDGGDGLVNPPEEVKLKISETWIGRHHSEETKRKIGEKSKGRKHTKKSKDHMRKIMTGREFTDEWRGKISKAVSKLTEDQVSEIRKLLSEGISQYVIADMFGVHQGTISNIKTGKFYK